MEDIRSTEILEKEVLEDARKKAERVVRNTEKQIAELGKEWKEKIEAELALLSAEAETKKALRKKEIEAAFPLETKRRKLRFMNGVFEKFLEDFFVKLPRKDLERILVKRAQVFTAFFAGKSLADLQGEYAGISAEAARSIAEALLGKPLRFEEGAEFTGIIVSAGAGTCRCRLTVAEIAGELREYHRKAIMDALWKDPL